MKFNPGDEIVVVGPPEAKLEKAQQSDRFSYESLLQVKSLVGKTGYVGKSGTLYSIYNIEITGFSTADYERLGMLKDNASKSVWLYDDEIELSTEEYIP